MANPNNLAELQALLASLQGTAQPAAPAAPAAPAGLPKLADLKAQGILPPAPADAYGWIGGPGNGDGVLEDIVVGGVKGAADLGLGAIELGLDGVGAFRDLLGGAVVKGTNLADVIVESLGGDLISQETLNKLVRVNDEASRDLDRVEENWVAGTGKLRDYAQQGADALGVGGAGGMVEDISRFVVPAVAAPVMAARNAATRGLVQGATKLGTLGKTAAFDGGLSAVSATETRDTELNRNLGDLANQVGLTEDNILASNEDDTDLERRLKFGANDALAALTIGGLLLGGGKAGRALLRGSANESGNTADDLTRTITADRSVAPLETQIDESLMGAAAARAAAADAPPVPTNQVGNVRIGGAGAAQQVPAPAPLAQGAPEEIPVRGMRFTGEGRKAREAAAQAETQPRALTADQKPLALPPPRDPAPAGFGDDAIRMSGPTTPPAPPARGATARSASEATAAARTKIAAIEPGQMVPMAKIHQELGAKPIVAKAVANDLEAAGYIRRTSKGFVRTDKVIPEQNAARLADDGTPLPFESGPVPAGRADEALPETATTTARAKAATVAADDAVPPMPTGRPTVEEARAILTNDMNRAAAATRRTAGKGVATQDETAASLRQTFAKMGGVNPEGRIAAELRNAGYGPGAPGTPPGLYRKTTGAKTAGGQVKANGDGDSIAYDDLVAKVPGVAWKRAAPVGQPGSQYVDEDQIVEVLTKGATRLDGAADVAADEAEKAWARSEAMLARLDAGDDSVLDEMAPAPAAAKADEAVEAVEDVPFKGGDDETKFSRAPKADEVQEPTKASTKAPTKADAKTDEPKPAPKDDLRAALTARAAKFGFTGERFKVVDGWVADAGTYGAYSPGGRAIVVSALSKEPMAVLNHEIFHALRPLLTAQENRFLERMAKSHWMDEFRVADTPGWKDLSEAEQLEEAMAQAFAKMTVAPPKTGLLGSIYTKLADFLKKTGSFLRGNGFDSAEAIMKRLEIKGSSTAGKEIKALDDIVKFSRAAGASDADAAATAAIASRYGDVAYFKEMLDRIVKSVAKMSDAVMKAVKNPKASSAAYATAVRNFFNHSATPWFHTTAGSIRALAEKHGVPEMSEIADAFRYTRKGNRGAMFNEIRQEIQGVYGNRLAEAIEPFAEDLAKRQAVRDLLTGAKKMDNGQDFPADVRQAAALMRNALDGIYREAKKAGIDLGYRDDWFPRMWDSAAIAKDEDGFVKAMEKALMDDGVDAATANVAAREMLDDITFGRTVGMLSDSEMVSDTMSKALKGRWERARKLGPEADKTLRAYLKTDPADALQHYAAAVSKRIAWERVLGDGKWEAVKKAMTEARVPKTEQDRFEYYVKVASGLSDNKLSRRTREILNGVHTTGTVSVMSHSLFSSLAEPFLAGMRSGNLLNGFKGIGMAIASAIPALRTASAREAREFAEDIGILNNSMMDTVMLARTNAAPGDSWWTHKTSQYYRKIGMSQWTDGTRAAVMQIGETYIQRTMRRAVAGRKVALRELEQLGLNLDDAKALIGAMDSGRNLRRDVVKNLNDNGVIKSGAEHPLDRYRRSLNRFVNETVMRPTEASRPAWANSPVGRVAYALTSYMFAFQTEVINRNLVRTKEALTESGLTAGERMELLAPMAMMVAAMPVIQAGVNEIRYGLLNPQRREDMTTSDRIMLGWSRAGLFGVLDPAVQAYQGTRYQRSLTGSIVGPYGNHFATAASDMLGAFSRETGGNSDERALARGLYNAFVLPALQLGASSVPFSAPAADWISRASIYAAPSSYAKNAWQDALGGEK